MTLRDRIAGAVLAAPDAVITGLSASALHGAGWIEDDVPVEMVAGCRRQPGLIVRNEALFEDEITTIAGNLVTTPARTAFDIARRLPRSAALARLDALMRAAPFGAEEVLLIAKRHKGVRGLRRLPAVLPLVDGGAESPRETWLRLLFIDAGLPRPTTQFVVRDELGRYVRRLDMCWEEFAVGAEYDGTQHLTDRDQYARDVRAERELRRLRWNIIHVIKEDRSAEIVHHARTALRERGWCG